MSLLLLIVIGVVLWSALAAGTHRARYRTPLFRSYGSRSSSYRSPMYRSPMYGGTPYRRGRFGFGRLPGDVHYRGRRTRVYAPIMSSLLVSLALSVLLTLLLNAALH